MSRPQDSEKQEVSLSDDEPEGVECLLYYLTCLSIPDAYRRALLVKQEEPVPFPPVTARQQMHDVFIRRRTRTFFGP